MRALVLGARGAVGSVIATELHARGHEVTAAGRSAAPDRIRIDLTAPDGMRALRDAATRHDVVVNASGVEDPHIAGALSGALLVDISATASYLDPLARDAPPGTGILLGAGLAPGLSTIMLSALETRPGDDLDLALTLGGGETHGEAAVAWTAALAGRHLYQPPEGTPVMNLRGVRRLPGAHGPVWCVRADFPDQLLVGAPHGLAVRSHLATDSTIATAALAVVGLFPALRGIVRHAPHIGGDSWSLTALNRRTGATITAHGTGQSHTTGILTAHMTIAAARNRPRRAVTAAEVLSLDEVSRIPGIDLTRP